MRAIGYYTTGSVDVLVDVDLPKPTPGPRDVLVEVRAISVNPVDAKIRSGDGPGGPGGDVGSRLRPVGKSVAWRPVLECLALSVFWDALPNHRRAKGIKEFSLNEGCSTPARAI